MSRKNNDYWAQTGCFGKQAFDTAALANKVAKLSSGRRSTPMNAYKCTVCLKYHIGNPNGKTKSYNQKPRRLENDHDQLL